MSQVPAATSASMQYPRVLAESKALLCRCPSLHPRDELALAYMLGRMPMRRSHGGRMSRSDGFSASMGTRKNAAGRTPVPLVAAGRQLSRKVQASGSQQRHGASENGP